MKKLSEVPFKSLLNIDKSKKLFELLLLPFNGNKITDKKVTDKKVTDKKVTDKKVTRNNSDKSVEEIQFIEDLSKVLMFEKTTFYYMYERLPQFICLSHDRKRVEDLKLKLEKIGATVQIIY